MTIAHVSFILFLFLSETVLAETRVVDGDTLELDNIIYRLNGVDAPEHGQNCGTWRCGDAATQTLVEIVKGREISCDPISKDGYGRVIATCYADGRDIGADLVDKGMAWAFVKYSDAYISREQAARTDGRGIWSGTAVPPWEFRKARWKKAAQDAPEGCPIKGNISRSGKIYHAPWSPWYARTIVSPDKGERWFCSESDALAAGWRAPFWN